jgi:hypothetical protein
MAFGSAGKRRKQFALPTGIPSDVAAAAILKGMTAHFLIGAAQAHRDLQGRKTVVSMVLTP